MVKFCFLRYDAKVKTSKSWFVGFFVFLVFLCITELSVDSILDESRQKDERAQNKFDQRGTYHLSILGI